MPCQFSQIMNGNVNISFFHHQVQFNNRSDELQWLIQDVYGQGTPYLTDRHVTFTNVNSYGIPGSLRPNWINVVREPVARLASRFFFFAHKRQEEEFQAKLPENFAAVSSSSFNILFNFLKKLSKLFIGSLSGKYSFPFGVIQLTWQNFPSNQQNKNLY